MNCLPLILKELHQFRNSNNKIRVQSILCELHHFISFCSLQFSRFATGGYDNVGSFFIVLSTLTLQNGSQRSVRYNISFQNLKNFNILQYFNIFEWKFTEKNIILVKHKETFLSSSPHYHHHYPLPILKIERATKLIVVQFNNIIQIL